MFRDDHAVYFGAVGWQHPAWVGELYPDDLPEDWLLAYYNTQFRAVFLPYEHWSQASAEEHAQWVQDTQPAFRFVLEPPPVEGATSGPAPAILADRLGGLAGRANPHLLWFDAQTDLKGLVREIMNRDRPLYLFSLDADLGGLQRVATLLELMGL